MKEAVLGLSLGKREFMLCAKWVDDAAKRHHRVHPEVLGFYASFGTNTEKRGLCRGCSKSPGLRNLPTTNSFTPSLQA